MYQETKGQMESREHNEQSLDTIARCLKELCDIEREKVCLLKNLVTKKGVQE